MKKLSVIITLILCLCSCGTYDYYTYDTMTTGTVVYHNYDRNVYYYNGIWYYPTYSTGYWYYPSRTKIYRYRRLIGTWRDPGCGYHYITPRGHHGTWRKH